MIHIDFALAVAGFLCFFIALVFSLWLFYTNFDSNKTEILENLHQCPYCTYVFFVYKKSTVYVCPRCKSFIEQNLEHKEAAL